MKWVAVITALIVAAPFAWIAGEQHRENCVRHGNASCSVLPWDNGETPRTPKETLVPLDGGWRVVP